MMSKLYVAIHKPLNLWHMKRHLMTYLAYFLHLTLCYCSIISGIDLVIYLLNVQKC